jgi:hypothetical protein
MTNESQLEDLACEYLQLARRAAQVRGTRVKVPGWVKKQLDKALRRKHAGKRERASLR